MKALDRYGMVLIFAGVFAWDNAQAIRIGGLSAEEASEGETALFAPIKVDPKAFLERDYIKQEQVWCEQALIAPFRERNAGQPWLNAATEFVNNALLYWHTCTGFSLTKMWDAVDYAMYSWQAYTTQPPVKALAEQGSRLITMGCHDPLVLYLQSMIQYDLDGNWQAHSEILNSALCAVETNSTMPRVLGYMILRRNFKLLAIAGDGRQTRLADKLVEYTRYLLEENRASNNVEVITRFISNNFYQAPKFEKPTLEKLANIFRETRWPDWSRHTLLGCTEAALAWADRGGDWAEKVTEAGWKGFGEHLGKACTELTEAWKLRPDQPMAAAEMLRVAGGGGCAESDSLRLWFDRAVAAQFDYEQAYWTMLWFSRPRWGGSHELMLAFGKACFDTRRFDTDVPRWLIVACDSFNTDSEAPDCRPLFHRPDIAPRLRELGRSMRDDPGHAANREMWLSNYAVYAWLTGDYALAADLLQKVGDTLHPKAAFNLRRHFESDETTLRNEVALFTSAARTDFERAESLLAAGDTPAARAAFEVALEKAGSPLARSAIAGRISALDIEQQLDKGDWVKLSAEPTLAQWLVRGGNWSVTTDGVLVNQGENGRGIILHRARIGPDFEARGEFEIKSRDQASQHIGIAIGWNARKLNNWTLCRIGQERKEPPATYLYSGTPSVTETFIYFHFAKINFQPVNRFLLRCRGEQVSLEVNGQMAIKEARLPVSNADVTDGLLGFADAHWRTGNTTSLRTIEVRRLKPSAQK
jgi:hypothetical protein